MSDVFARFLLNLAWPTRKKVTKLHYPWMKHQKTGIHDAGVNENATKHVPRKTLIEVSAQENNTIIRMWILSPWAARNYNMWSKVYAPPVLKLISHFKYKFDRIFKHREICFGRVWPRNFYVEAVKILVKEEHCEYSLPGLRFHGSPSIFHGWESMRMAWRSMGIDFPSMGIHENRF